MQSSTDADGRFAFDSVVEEERLRISAHLPGYEETHQELSQGQYENIEMVLYEEFDPAKKLSNGVRAPEFNEVEWLQGSWDGFDAVRGGRVAVAFVSVKNRACRRAIQALQDAVLESTAPPLHAVLVHDASASRDEIAEYLATNEISLATARVTVTPHSGWHSASFRDYRIQSLPEIVLIDTDGKVLSGKTEVAALKM